MKILFQNRKKSYWTGGDYVQMEKTAEALRLIGYEVDISEEQVVSPATIEQYDLVHLWNFSMPWTKYQLWVARKHKKPVVCSMIYHESDQFIPYNLQQIMLNELSAQIYLTESEKERVARRLDPTGKSYVIPNGLDEFWLKPINVPKENIVLTTGRIEPFKGQLAVARACKKLEIPYYCAGEVQDEAYGEQVRESGAILLGKLEPKELIKWYARSRTFALVSKAEIYPLSVMEAMAQGCQILLTITSEWKPKVNYAMYDDENSILNGLKICMRENNEYKEYVAQFTWKNVALSIKSIYESLYTIPQDKV